jgi:Tol biopolymer transport system component
VAPGVDPSLKQFGLDGGRGKGNDGTTDLFRVPVNGGAPQRIVGDISGPAGLSPDGRQAAFIRLKPTSWEASLVVANTDGSGEFVVRTVQRPNFFDETSVAWSSDGQAIALFAGGSTEFADSGFRLIEVSLHHPGQRVISQEPWKPLGLAWAPKGDVLILTAMTQADDAQLFIVRHSNGEVMRLTNDLSDYGRVSITDDAKSL